MRYGITRLAIGQQPFIEISEDEFCKTKAAKQDLIVFLEMEDKLDILLENYAEYERELLGLTLRRLLFRDSDWSSLRGDVQLINRRLANLLTSGRLYIDQIQHDLATLYGDKSQEAESIRQATRTEYANSFGYRAIDAMRNHIQHRSLPVEGLSYPFKWIGEEPRRQMRRTVVPTINVAAFRSDSKFKRSVLVELEQKGEEFNITPLVREYVQSLSNIHSEVRQLTAPRLNGCDEIFLGVCERAREPLGPEIVGLGIVAQSARGRYDESVHIVEDLVKRRRALSRKNRHLKALTRWYISSECLEDA